MSRDRGTPTQGFERQGSKRGSSRQNGLETHNHGRTRQDERHNNNMHTTKASHVMTDNSYPADTRVDRRNHNSRHGSQQVPSRNSSRHPSELQHSSRHPSELQPLANSVRGLSLSQQLLHVNPPFEDLHFGMDDDGAILVKVHAAQDAHLIDENLRSHHYCTSPYSSNNNNRFFDLANSPKPHRPRSKMSADPGSRGTSSPRQGRRGQKGVGAGENDQGKYLLFQTPDDLQGVRWSDEDWSDEEGGGKAGSSRSRSKRGRDGKPGNRKG